MERGEGEQREGKGKGSANVMNVSRSCKANVYGRRIACLVDELSWENREVRTGEGEGEP